MASVIYSSANSFIQVSLLAPRGLFCLLCQKMCTLLSGLPFDEGDKFHRR